MRIEILGSAGAVGTPRPGCGSRVCGEAREKGVPYSRTGPSTFVHGPGVLFDTPEESKHQLNRSGVHEVSAAFYSHWHPDHVMGRRVWEELNYDWRSYPPSPRSTPVYLPEQVAQDFRERLGTWEHLSFLARIGVVELIELSDGEPVAIGTTTIVPFRLAEDYVYAFVLEDDGRRALVAPDELNGWMPPPELGRFDLAVLPMGSASSTRSPESGGSIRSTRFCAPRQRSTRRSRSSTPSTSTESSSLTSRRWTA